MLFSAHCARNTLTIEPMAGLCNRMRALDSALQLSGKINIPLHLIWNLDRHCNCKFDDLFVVPESINDIKYVSKNNRLTRALYSIKISFYYNKYYLQNDIESLMKLKYNFEQIKDHESVYVSTYSIFYRKTSPFIQFKPVAALADIIDSYSNEINNAIGVHIRRSGYIYSINNSPTELFINYMNNEIKADDNAMFFLATDSLSDENVIKDIFGDRIITHKKTSFDRKTPQAIKDALVDLYCLSKCSKIIGSYLSSFSETASEINGIGLETVNSATYLPGRK